MASIDLKFSHFGLHVIDMARMEDFYSRVLGFTVTDRGRLQRPRRGGTSLGGGKGGILRTAVGVLMLTVLNNGLLIAGVSVNIRSAVSGGILIVAIVAAAWPYRSRLRIMK